jgi:acyl carrier protein
MDAKIIDILTEIRPEFDFSKPINFIDEGMLDSFDLIRLVSELDKEYKISIDGVDVLPENFSSIENILKLLYKNGVNK